MLETVLLYFEDISGSNSLILREFNTNDNNTMLMQ